MSEISTVERLSASADSILKNDIDQRLVKLRPMATPVDQISRFGRQRPVTSMEVEYYAVAMRGFETTLTKGLSAVATLNEGDTLTLRVAQPEVCEPSDTVMIDGVTGTDGMPLLFYVTGSTPETNEIRLTAVGDNCGGALTGIANGTRVVRMGRAAGELDVQTGLYEALPQKKSNHCQIFKQQIEQSTLLARHGKKVAWSLADQEEVAVYDMRLSMERTFLFGTKARYLDPTKKSEIYFTGGIWGQAGSEARYSGESMTQEQWVKIMSQAFTGHDGSARKVLIAGTGLIERLSTMDGGQQRVMTPETKVTRWGLDFSEIVSKFGRLYVIHSEVMDSCGHRDDGLIIDPEYLTKYIHTPFKAESLDLRKSGQRNTEAVVLTEISCLVLRYPQAHCRVVKR